MEIRILYVMADMLNISNTHVIYFQKEKMVLEGCSSVL